jgi:hypothetical protein
MNLHEEETIRTVVDTHQETVFVEDCGLVHPVEKNWPGLKEGSNTLICHDGSQFNSLCHKHTFDFMASDDTDLLNKITNECPHMGQLVRYVYNAVESKYAFQANVHTDEDLYRQHVLRQCESMRLTSTTTGFVLKHLVGRARFRHGLSHVEPGTLPFKSVLASLIKRRP